METLNAREFLLALGRVSAQAGMLVLIVLLLQWLLRKQLAPRWRCAMWLLVAARLVLPVSLPSAASIFNFAPEWKTTDTSARQARTVIVPQTPAVPTGPQLSATELRSVAEPPIADNRMVAEPRGEVVEVSAAVPSPVGSAMATTTLDGRSKRSQWNVSWPTILFTIWAVGVMVLLVHVLWTSIRLARTFNALKPVTDPAVLAVLAECKQRLELRRAPEIVESDKVNSPVLHGLFRARLLLPKGFVTTFSECELRFIFLHELAHVKRKDIPMNWIVTVLQLLHWFNPLVWFGFARWRADRELACDALALEAAGAEQKQEYGKTILRLLESFTPRTAAPGLVGILEDKRQLQQRIISIASFRSRRGRWGVLSLLLLVVLGVVCLTDAQPQKVGAKPKSDKTLLSSSAKTNDLREVRHGADPDLGTTNLLDVQSLTVLVLDPKGQPLENAEVVAPYMDWGKSAPRRLTDASGKFIVKIPLAPKEARSRMTHWSVSARRSGYATHTAAWSSANGDVYSMMPREVTVQLENGNAVGGTVRDDKGVALSGVKVLLSGSAYRGFSMGGAEKKSHEYGELASSENDPAAVTDAKGHWTFAHLPSDITDLTLTFVRPDGSRDSYSTKRQQYINSYPVVTMATLRDQSAVFTMRTGLTVRGIVVDENGKPIAGATVQEGYGHGNMTRVSTFTTDRNGRFEAHNRVPRQWIYTASTNGRAMVSVVAQVEPGMPDVKIVLPPAQPLLARIVDSDHKPIAGADVKIDTYRSEGQILDWESTSDGDGRVFWSNAPLQTVTFYANDKKTGATRKFKAAGGQEKIVVLSTKKTEAIRVDVTVTDNTTHEAVNVRAVSIRYAGGFDGFHPYSEPNAGHFSVDVKMSDIPVGMYPTYALRLEAEGYEPLITEDLDFEEGNQAIELQMRRGGPVTVMVLSANGQPAKTARAWVRTRADGSSLFINSPNRYYGDRLGKAGANASGKIILPQLENEGPRSPKNPTVIFNDADGFVTIPFEDFKKTAEVRLLPWGRVEGVLKVGGVPTKGKKVDLSSLNWGSVSAFNLIYSTTTKADGSFVFTNVPAGDYKLYQQQFTRMGRAITEDHPIVINVKPGETTRVEYGGTGRAVVGQAVGDPADVAVNWSNDDHVLVSKQTELPQLNREDFASFKAYLAANDKEQNSPARLEQARNVRQYQLLFDEDGTFRVEDVLPGTYELRIRITKPVKGDASYSREQPELGSLTREVVIPDGKEPFSLGKLIVPVQGEVAVKSPAIDLTVRSLEGDKDIDLSQLRGKNVVLAFWAAWSGRSTEQLAEIQKLHGELGKSEKFAFLTVSLDEDPAEIKKAVESRGYRWPQARLEMADRADVTEKFAVDTLPAVFLIDTEGRIVGRDLDAVRLRKAVDRALNKK